MDNMTKDKSGDRKARLDADLERQLDLIRREEIPDRLMQLALELQRKLREADGQ